MTEERRLVTVLFADVTGSTALGESLDPEDLRALLGRYYATAKDVIGAHGGTVEKFIGDAVMAVFGLPVAHGDDAERALAAALELRDRLRSDTTLGDRIPVRFGVNTGDVVATRDTTGGDFLITGDPVNVAARLQQSAAPWEIVVGERTVRATDRAFTFDALGAVDAKGKIATVRAARLAGRATGPRRIRIPLIGRSSELAQLDIVAERALRQRRPSLVSIVAPAGTGKTRLLEELLDRLPTSVPGCVVAIAQCLPYGQRLTYWPLRAVLFRLIGVEEDASAPEIRAAIARWLEGAEVEDRERILELLAATVGAGESDVSDRAALFAAWRTAFEVAASRAPLAIVFEDLHWSSDSLLDLVEFVMQPRGEVPVLTLALTRPELLDRRPGWGGGRRNYVSIALEPLADEDIASIVAHLLETSPREVVERVVARAEGNPFYAGELVRSLMERAGSLREPASVERALAALPDTVQATVLARLDVLAADERRVLQLGSVFGRSFAGRGIVSLEPALASGVDGALEDLVEKDMIRPVGGGRYAFRHILIREVAYQTLPRSERARLHAAAGQWLETAAEGRDAAFAELIAFHYREAATLPRGDDSAQREVRRRATEWLRRAAEAAAAAAASVEAKRHLVAAIELAEPDVLPDLYERLGDVWRSGEASDAYRTALRLAREQGRGADQQTRILAGLLEVLMRSQGSVASRPSDDEMAALRADAAAVAERATDERAIARYLAAESFYPSWLLTGQDEASDAELDEAETKARRAIAIAQRLGDVGLESAALDGLGAVAQRRGDLQLSRDLAVRRMGMRDLDLAERLDAFGVATWMSVWMGELREAVRISDAGIGVAQPGQAPYFALHLYTWRTYTLFLRGDWREAIAAGDRMIHLWTECGRISAGYALRGLLAAHLAAAGMKDSAAMDRTKQVIDAIASAFEGKSPARLASALVQTGVDVEAVLAAIFARPSPHPDLMERALSVACDLGRPPDPEVVRAQLARFGRRFDTLRHLRAQVERAAGLARGDAATLERARSAFEAMEARPFAARARCERAILVGDRAELDAGLAELERIGDGEQIRRYEERAGRI